MVFLLSEGDSVFFFFFFLNLLHYSSSHFLLAFVKNKAALMVVTGKGRCVRALLYRIKN
jgi:hypothetical protein